MTELAGSILGIYLDAAPWLLLGLLAAGLIKAWVPDGLLASWLGGRGIWPITKAAVIGAPLPLCSCGVLPAAIGLHRGGASRGSTLSFLIATPETGADSVALSYALLGPFMTVVRPLAALFSAIVTGLLGALVPLPESKAAASQSSCGGGCAGSCSSGFKAVQKAGALTRARAGLRYAFGDILDDIAMWLAVGIVVAGVVDTYVPPQALAAWGSGLPAMLLMVLIGIPMYICATASTPIAAALLMAGVSPGTVLVFLLAGPATNFATLVVVKRELGGATLGAYLFGITLSSIVAGLFTDYLATAMGVIPEAQLAQSSELLPAWLAWGSAVVLALLAVKPIRRRVLLA